MPGHLTEITIKTFQARFLLAPNKLVNSLILGQVARLRYLLSHGPKEGLVQRPQDWPGIHCAKTLLKKSFDLVGHWVDRTGLDDARRKAQAKKRQDRDHRPAEADFTTVEVVHLSKLPCWSHLSDDDYFEQIRLLVDGILDDYEDVRMRAPKNAAREITRQDPEHRPGSTKKGPKPICHAATSEMRRRYRAAKVEWLALYRAASDALRGGDLGALAHFPAEASLPRLPRELATQGRAP